MKVMDFSTLPKIAAVDFDGYLVEDKFPKVGNPNLYEIALVKCIQQNGVKTILWTSRTDDSLTEAIEACKNFGLEFDAVNTNIQEVKDLTGRDTRKVYADVYLDDKAGTIHDAEIAERLAIDIGKFQLKHDLLLCALLGYIVDSKDYGVTFEDCMSTLRKAFDTQED